MNLTAIEDAHNYHFVQGDVTDAALVQELFATQDFTTVVHFAAESHVDRSILEPLAFVQSNTMGTVTLLEAARHAWTDAADDPARYRFFHVSTDEVFGSLGDDGAFTETTAYDPRSPYSASKAASDHFVRAYAHTYGLPVSISNCSNNYGPYQFPEKLIPLVIMNTLHERPVPIYGQGDNVRDWLHVHDHCDAIDVILRGGTPGETYLVGGNNERSNLDLVTMLLDLVDEALGRPAGTAQQLITFVKDRAGHDFRYAIDATHLRETLGWQPQYSPEDGLRATVAWYLDNQSWLDAVSNASYRAYYEQQYAAR